VKIGLWTTPSFTVICSISAAPRPNVMALSIWGHDVSGLHRDAGVNRSPQTMDLDLSARFVNRDFDSCSRVAVERVVVSDPERARPCRLRLMSDISATARNTAAARGASLSRSSR